MVKGSSHYAIRDMETYVTLRKCFLVHCSLKTMPSNKAQLLQVLVALTYRTMCSTVKAEL